MAEKVSDLIINEWQRGVAQSPYLGFADMRNVNLNEKPGALLIGFKATKESATTITGLPTWIVINPSNGTLYACDTDNKIYTSTDDGDSWSLVSGNTTSAGSGNGLAVWKDYLFLFRNTAIDVYGPLSGSPAWTNGWKTIDTAEHHPAIATQDDKLTFGAGRYVGTIQETASTTFLPSDAGTYTFTAQKLTLPAQYKIKCLAELGLDLKIGTWVGTNLYDAKIGVIFGWDRVSSSYAGSRTIFIQENGINQMKSVQGRLWFTAGVKANLYVSEGGAPTLAAEWKMVDHITNSGSNLDPRPGAIEFHNGKILVGIGGGAGSTPIGVLSYEIRTAAQAIERTISTGSVTGSTKIGALFSVSGEVFVIGWQDGTGQGADMVGKDGKRSTSYEAYADSALIRAGSASNKRQFSEVEIILGRELAANQGVRVSWRDALNDSFTAMGTYDHSTYGAVSVITAVASVPDIANIQLRVELTTGSDSTTTPELLEVRLR